MINYQSASLYGQDNPDRAHQRMLRRQTLRDAMAGCCKTLHAYRSLRFARTSEEPMFEQRATIIADHLVNNARWVAAAPTANQAADRLELAIKGALERGGIRPDPVVCNAVLRAVAMAHDEITINTIKEYGRE